jgi:hypothetical protein
MKSIVSIKRRKVLQALILCDYNYFNQRQSNFILNIFTIDPDEITSPLAKISILQLLLDQKHKYQSEEKIYLKVEQVQDYLEPIGFERSFLVSHLQKLLEFRLIEPYDPNEEKVYEMQRIRITPAGSLHYQFSMSNPTYVAHMGLTTAIRDYSIAASIKAMTEKKMAFDDWVRLTATFIKYCLEQDDIFVNIPDNVIYEGQQKMRQELLGKWVKKRI